MVNQPENQSQPATPELIAQPVSQKFCPKCGTLNAPDAQFCYKCGMPLLDAAAPGKKICAGCGTANEAASQYCLKCGLKLPEATVSGAPRHYAGFWIRLGAIFIDTLILSTVTGIISSPFLLPIMNNMMKDFRNYNQDTDPYYFFQNMMNSDWYLQLASFAFLSFLINTVVYCAYYTVGVGKWGTTIGKTACGLTVVSANGSRVSYKRAFARYWARVLNGITAGLSYLVIAFNGKKQGIHDMMCNTIVVKKQ